MMVCVWGRGEIISNGVQWEKWVAFSTRRGVHVCVCVHVYSACIERITIDE